MSAAATVVLASRTGMPVSTTHIAVGAVMIGSIFVSWVITLPIGGLLAALLFFTLKGMFT
jgi:PiT family inorganic phosphate transporter